MIRQLFNEMDLTNTSLSAVAKELRNGDTVKGCDLLLDYYHHMDRNWVVQALDPMDDSTASEIARVFNHDSILIHGVADHFPVLPTGVHKWNHLGPDHDAEFAYSLNAQSYLPAFYVDYQVTGRNDNITTFNDLIQDWVLQHPVPHKDDSIFMVLNGEKGLDYRDIDEYEWRTLDAGRRLGAAWPQTFYGFQPNAQFTPATRLLMLKSMAEQANYLMNYHKHGHNWTTMEMNGLALVGLAFPEFKKARAWADYALKVMEREINRQVYPDGVQTELSSKTQWVALRRFESLAQNFHRAGRKVTPEYLHRVEEMYDFLAYSMRPDGHQVLNNDSDREDLRPRVLTAAKQYIRPDWTYVATNGREGELPSKGPSLTYPWAGIQVWRNGWSEDADWSFFDQGPYGTGHQHRDMLHLSVASFGHDLLVDGGRFTHQDYFSFDPTVWRGYFRSSFSHNVILINGQGQNAGIVRSSEPLEEGLDFVHTADYDFARGTFDQGFTGVDDQVIHHRSVLYLKNHIWLVIDEMAVEDDTELTALWHFSPECVLEQNEDVLQSVNQMRPNVKIVPLGEIDWKIDVVKGQESPLIQGWYSADYGEKIPNPTGVYHTTINQNSTFAWLIITGKGEPPAVSAEFGHSDENVHCVIQQPGQNPIRIYGPLDHPSQLNVKMN